MTEFQGACVDYMLGMAVDSEAFLLGRNKNISLSFPYYNINKDRIIVNYNNNTKVFICPLKIDAYIGYSNKPAEEKFWDHINQILKESECYLTQEKGSFYVTLHCYSGIEIAWGMKQIGLVLLEIEHLKKVMCRNEELVLRHWYY